MIQSLINFFRRKNNTNTGIYFQSFGETPYHLSNGTPDCYGYLGGEHVCTFETLSIRGNSFHIEHFAVETDVIGNKVGEKSLRAFAKLISSQNPSLEYISFSLHRSTSATKNSEQSLIKLAEARQALLEKIGAVEIEVSNPNSECYDVTARWYKDMWLDEPQIST